MTRTTLDAVLTNRSHLLSTVVGYESARLLSKEWAGAGTPETITRLAKYTFLASVTLHGEVVPPFLVRGQEVSELFEAAGEEAGSRSEPRLSRIAPPMEWERREGMVDDDDPVKDAAREIAAAARAVATGLKKRDRPQELQPHEMAAVLAERRRREGMVDNDDYGLGLDFGPAD